MTNSGQESFGVLLRRNRIIKSLTQEALAELVGVSTRGISDLERGIIRSPHRETLRRLIEVFSPPDEDRVLLEAAARRPPRRSAIPSDSGVALSTLTSSLIGRDEDLATIRGMLLHANARLVTLTGPGGVGKTSLALQIASDIAGEFEAGCIVVSLAPIDDKELIVPAIARALNLRPAESESGIDAIRRWIGSRTALLVLDNVEQVGGSAEYVSSLLSACASLAILVTSRAPLRVSGEHEMPISPLPAPETGAAVPTDIAKFPAVELFVRRAKSANASFALTRENAVQVAKLVRLLDGLPLAIELAAAWSRAITATEMVDRVTARLDLLVDGDRVAPARHRTMRDTIGWSYNLLRPPEQRLFRRLAVFSGGFTLESAASICFPPETETESEETLLTGLSALITASLITRSDTAGDRSRFSMLETIRVYARECLGHSGELALLSARHARWFASAVETIEPRLHGPEAHLWLNLLESDHGNLRDALRWSATAGDWELAARIATAIWRFWQNHGHLSEGRRWFREILQHAPAIEPRRIARCWNGDAALALRQGAFADAAFAAGNGIAVATSAGFQDELAVALNFAGIVAEYRADYDTAERYYRDALHLHRSLGNQFGVAIVLGNLAIVMNDQGYFDAAKPLLAESLNLRRDIGDRWGIALSLVNLCISEIGLGNLAGAQDLAWQGRVIFTEIGDDWGIALATNEIGRIVDQTGGHAEALYRFREGLRLRHRIGDRLGIARSLESLAISLIENGEFASGARLLTAATTIRASTGAPLPIAMRPRQEAAERQALNALGERQFRAVTRSGELLTIDDAVAEGLENWPV